MAPLKRRGARRSALGHSAKISGTPIIKQPAYFRGRRLHPGPGTLGWLRPEPGARVRLYRQPPDFRVTYVGQKGYMLRPIGIPNVNPFWVSRYALLNDWEGEAPTSREEYEEYMEDMDEEEGDIDE